jgi:hypothetical protein
MLQPRTTGAVTVTQGGAGADVSQECGCASLPEPPLLLEHPRSHPRALPNALPQVPLPAHPPPPPECLSPTLSSKYRSGDNY